MSAVPKKAVKLNPSLTPLVLSLGYQNCWRDTQKRQSAGLAIAVVAQGLPWIFNVNFFK